MMDPRDGWHWGYRLPHFDSSGLVHAITFCLADAHPGAGSRGTDGERCPEEVELDRCLGSCWLRDPVIAALVQGSLLRFDRVRYMVHAWVIMPNHVHALLEPLPGFPLWKTMNGWKGYTGHEANRLLGRSGPFWGRDYRDRYIRNDRHYAMAVQYIHCNPVKAGLVDEAEQWRWSSARDYEARILWLAEHRVAVG